MDYFTTVGVCSLYRDIGLILAMVVRFGSGNPHTVEDARHFLGVDIIDDQQQEDLGQSLLPVHRTPKSADDAWRTYQQIVADGGTPVLGLLPVTPDWARMFGREPRELLDPCTAVSVGTAMLEEFARQCGGRARACVVRKYAQAIAMESYADDVLAELRASHDNAEGRRVAPIETNAIREADLPVDLQAEAQWGVAQLAIPELVPTRPEPERRPAPPRQPAPRTSR